MLALFLNTVHFGVSLGFFYIDIDYIIQYKLSLYYRLLCNLIFFKCLSFKHIRCLHPTLNYDFGLSDFRDCDPPKFLLCSVHCNNCFNLYNVLCVGSGLYLMLINCYPFQFTLSGCFILLVFTGSDMHLMCKYITVYKDTGLQKL